MNIADLDAYVARTLATAPTITDATRENVTRLLRPGARKRPTR